MFWQNFILLCSKNDQSPNGVCAELGLSSAIATRWKNGSIPRDTTLKKIADYFGVSVDDLLKDEGAVPTSFAEKVELPPLSPEFYELLEKMTLSDLKELKSIMEEKVNSRK